MADELRMNAYYYGFTPTGVREIDMMPCRLWPAPARRSITRRIGTTRRPGRRMKEPRRLTGFREPRTRQRPRWIRWPPSAINGSEPMKMPNRWLSWRSRADRQGTHKMNWIRSFFRPRRTRQYRIVRRLEGYEPQFSFNAGTVEALSWYPLNAEGYWLEPDAFTNGNPTKHLSMTRADARRAILRARAINEEHIKVA